MCSRKINTDPDSPRLFECECTVIVVDEDDGDESSYLESDELRSLLEAAHDDCSPLTGSAIPTLLDKEKEEMASLIRDVSAILFECDPMCLNFGTNSDEYDPEAVTIISMLKNTETENDSIEAIVDTFRRWFGEDHSEYKNDRKYISMAHRIWVACSEHQEDAKNG